MGAGHDYSYPAISILLSCTCTTVVHALGPGKKLTSRCGRIFRACLRSLATVRPGPARLALPRLGSARIGSARFLFGLVRFGSLWFALLSVNCLPFDYLVPRAWSTRVALQGLQRVRLFPVKGAFFLHAGVRGSDSGLGHR